MHIVDLESKFKALKASWIPKILSCNHRLKDFLESFCQRNGYDLNYLLKTNDSFLNEDEMLPKHIPYFYREILPISMKQRKANQKHYPSHKIFGEIKDLLTKIGHCVLQIG